jgi:hypothetical protein
MATRVLRHPTISRNVERNAAIVAAYDAGDSCDVIAARFHVHASRVSHLARDAGRPPRLKAIRPIRVDGNIAFVTLTKGYHAIIDAIDVERVTGWNWSVVVSSGVAYACRSERSGGVRRVVMMHRVIIDAPIGMEVDHKDGDSLNNRRLNLRLATRCQNNQNQRRPVSNTSGVKGVQFERRRGKWRAIIYANRKNIWLGYFSSRDAAREAYAKASRKYHGEFGRLE